MRNIIIQNEFMHGALWVYCGYMKMGSPPIIL